MAATSATRRPDTAAVEIHGLVKTFGHTRALDGLDLIVRPGSVTGFLGPNGAGTSTTIRLLLELLRAIRLTLAALAFLPAVAVVAAVAAPSSISVVALSVMTLIAIAITGVAGWLYRRRDVLGG
jgi:ABC-type Na+ transport system ATPase subunit NatA